jgi:hypothetical protein
MCTCPTKERWITEAERRIIVESSGTKNTHQPLNQSSTTSRRCANPICLRLTTKQQRLHHPCQDQAASARSLHTDVRVQDKPVFSAQHQSKLTIYVLMASRMYVPGSLTACILTPAILLSLLSGLADCPVMTTSMIH